MERERSGIGHRIDKHVKYEYRLFSQSFRMFIRYKFSIKDVYIKCIYTQIHISTYIPILVIICYFQQPEIEKKAGAVAQ